MYWVLGQEAFAGLGWPVEHDKHSSGKYTYPKPVMHVGSAQVHALHCTDPAQWIAVGFTFDGPVVQFLKNTCDGPELQGTNQMMHLRYNGEFVPLLQFAAAKAFYNMDLTLLKNIQSCCSS